MKRFTQLALLALAGCAISTVAISEPAPNNGPQARAILEKRRLPESTSHKQRIRILQEADACINAAPDYRSFRDCERQEQQARQDLRDQLRPEVEALHSEWQAFRAAHHHK